MVSSIKKIGIDCRALMDEKPSGVSIYTRELVRNLLKVSVGRNIHYVLFANGASFFYSPYGKKKLLALFSSLKGTDQSSFEWCFKKIPNKFFALSEIFFQRPLLRWMFGNVDVALLPNAHFFPFRDRSLPYVAIFHDLSLERYPDCFDWRRRLRSYLLREKNIAKNAQYCIAVSHHTAADLQELYNISGSKIKVIYPGLGPKFFENDTDQNKNSLTKICPWWTTSDRYILVISTIEPRKNIITLLQVFDSLWRRYPALHLVIVGVLGWKSKKLEKNFFHAPNVHYLDYVPEEQKKFLLQQASALVYCSLYEGFGFPPLEAQAAGVPVVAAANSSLMEIVGDSALLVNSYDIDSLRSALASLLMDDKITDYYRQKGLENVKRFNWQRAAEEIFQVLTSLKNTTL